MNTIQTSYIVGCFGNKSRLEPTIQITLSLTRTFTFFKNIQCFQIAPIFNFPVSFGLFFNSIKYLDLRKNSFKDISRKQGNTWKKREKLRWIYGNFQQYTVLQLLRSIVLKLLQRLNFIAIVKDLYVLFVFFSISCTFSTLSRLKISTQNDWNIVQFSKIWCG